MINQDKNAGFIARNVKRGSKFLIAGGSGFLTAEFILFLGLRLVGVSYLVEINIVAAILSVTLGFFINEYWTSRNEGNHDGGYFGLSIRLVKFQLIYALGNVVSILTQLFFYYILHVTPLIGNIFGAIAALPVNYVISMILVWRIKL